MARDRRALREAAVAQISHGENRAVLLSVCNSLSYINTHFVLFTKCQFILSESALCCMLVLYSD